MSKSKYEKGKKITSMSEFVSSNAKCYKLYNRTWNRTAVEQLQYAQINKLIERNALYEAKLKEE